MHYLRGTYGTPYIRIYFCVLNITRNSIKSRPCSGHVVKFVILLLNISNMGLISGLSNVVGM